MLWITIVMAMVVALAVLGAIHARRPANVGELAPVSSHWLAQHRVDAP